MWYSMFCFCGNNKYNIYYCHTKNMENMNYKIKQDLSWAWAVWELFILAIICKMQTMQKENNICTVGVFLFLMILEDDEQIQIQLFYLLHRISMH